MKPCASQFAMVLPLTWKQRWDAFKTGQVPVLVRIETSRYPGTAKVLAYVPEERHGQGIEPQTEAGEP